MQDQPSLANAKAAITSGFKGLFKKVMDQASNIAQTVNKFEGMVASGEEGFKNAFEESVQSM